MCCMRVWLTAEFACCPGLWHGKPLHAPVLPCAFLPAPACSAGRRQLTCSAALKCLLGHDVVHGRISGALHFTAVSPYADTSRPSRSILDACHTILWMLCKLFLRCDCLNRKLQDPAWGSCSWQGMCKHLFVSDARHVGLALGTDSPTLLMRCSAD